MSNDIIIASYYLGAGLRMRVGNKMASDEFRRRSMNQSILTDMDQEVHLGKLHFGNGASVLAP